MVRWGAGRLKWGGRRLAWLLLALQAPCAWAEYSVSEPVMPPPVPLATDQTPSALVAPMSNDKAEDKAVPAEPGQVMIVPTSCITRDDQGRFMGWMDYQHCMLSGRTMATARWFDDLFGNWYADQASMLVRIRTVAIWDQKTGTQFVPSINASAQLPNASKRLRLVISDDRTDLGNNSENVSPEKQRQLGGNSLTAAIRFVPVTLKALRIDTDVGLRGGPDLFLRARVRNSWNLNEDSVLRAGETLRYAVQDRGRALTELGIEHVLPGDALLTFSNALSYWEKEDSQVGMRWNQGLALTRALGGQQSLTLGVGTEGVTRPRWERDSYGIWVTVRRQFLRDWLFYEIEPRITRYRIYSWDAIPSLTLRLEVQLGRQ